MLRSTLFAAIMALLSVSWNADAQTAAVDDPENEASADYSEVFVMRYRGSRATHNFELPENRAEWLAIAEKVVSGQIDDAVYYALVRGDKPADIFTPDFMGSHQDTIDDWLVQKWAPVMEADQEIEPVVVSVGPFTAFGEGGSVRFRPDGSSEPVAIDCSRKLEKLDRFSKDGNRALPNTEELNAMYEILLGQNACGRNTE